MSEFGGLWKHNKNILKSQHALTVTVKVKLKSVRIFSVEVGHYTKKKKNFKSTHCKTSETVLLVLLY